MLKRLLILLLAATLGACSSINSLNPFTPAKRPMADAVATAHPAATEAGLAMLAAGGNAFDAAVAVSAALAVVEPYSSGMGGGGFWMLRPEGERVVVVDGRETAPGAAHRDMYLDDKGEVLPGLSIDGPLSAGIPGQPAALAHISRTYGRLPLSRALAPAIRLAREGFKVTPHYQKMAGWRLDALNASPEAAAAFLLDGEVPPLGHLIKQPELANTLEAMAERGAEGFYTGSVAEAMVAAVREAGGIWSLEDLAGYAVVERKPLLLKLDGRRIYTMPPPSSGGVALISMLRMLDAMDYEKRSEGEQNHLLIEVMRRAYRDRAQFLGDADFVEVPVERLTGGAHARELAESIDMARATPSAELPGYGAPEGGNDTTHFSILDREGNAVSATLSINYPFGSGFVAGDSGILLNDEMDDFSAKPGVPNAYGLVGSEANAIAPGKRMLSSMSPTIIDSGERMVILGTPGGSRIITMVLQGIIESAEGGDAEAIVARPRLHHQYLPDKLFIEPRALDAIAIEELRERGHVVVESDSSWGNMQAVTWDKEGGEVKAGSDLRVEGRAEVREPE